MSEVIQEETYDEETEKALKEIKDAPETEEGEDKSVEPNKDDKPEEKEEKKEEDKEEKKEDEDKEEEKKDEEKEDDKEEEDDKDDKKEEDDEEDLENVTEGKKVKMVESWRVEVAKKKIAKEFEGSKKEMETQISTLKEALEEADKKVGKAEKDEATEQAISKLAEDSGVDEKTIKGLVDIININKPQIEKPTVATERLEKLEAEAEDARQESLFEKEFTKRGIDKLIGTDIPEENRAEAKKLLHDLSFTKRYLEVPLKELYRNSALDTLKTGVEKKGTKSATPSSQQAKGEISETAEMGPDSTEAEKQAWVEKKLKEGNKEMFGATKRDRKTI